MMKKLNEKELNQVQGGGDTVQTTGGEQKNIGNWEANPSPDPNDDQVRPA